MRTGKEESYREEADNAITFEGRLCVPNDEALRNEIMSEAHETPYTAHPGSTKMYQDMKKQFWWDGMKRSIASFVERCLACQQVKALHQRPYGKLQPLEIPRVEMGAHCDGFRDRIAKVATRKHCYLGDYRSPHQKRSLYTDSYHLRIRQVSSDICTRDHTPTWNTSDDHFRP